MLHVSNNIFQKTGGHILLGLNLIPDDCLKSAEYEFLEFTIEIYYNVYGDLDYIYVLSDQYHFDIYGSPRCKNILKFNINNMPGMENLEPPDVKTKEDLDYFMIILRSYFEEDGNERSKARFNCLFD